MNTITLTLTLTTDHEVHLDPRPARDAAEALVNGQEIRWIDQGVHCTGILNTLGARFGSRHALLERLAAATGLTYEDLVSRRRTAPLVKGRQFAYWWLAVHGRLTTQDVAHTFTRAHGAVCHGIRTVLNRRETDKKYVVWHDATLSRLQPQTT